MLAQLSRSVRSSSTMRMRTLALVAASTATSCVRRRGSGGRVATCRSGVGGERGEGAIDIQRLLTEAGPWLQRDKLQQRRRGRALAPRRRFTTAHKQLLAETFVK